MASLALFASIQATLRKGAKRSKKLDDNGATSTRIVVSGDLDEYRIAQLADHPIDGYGVGTQLVVGSGHATAGMVYKLVAVGIRT